MLILERKAGEKLYIGNDITISILKTNDHRTRIGIEAPLNLNILRDNTINKNPKHKDGKIC